MCDYCKDTKIEIKDEQELPQWKKDLQEFSKELNRKSAEEKYNKTMEYSNKMLEECITKNPDKVSKECVNMINKMIESNKCEMYPKKEVCEKKKSKLRSLQLPWEDDEPNRNNRFIIEIESKFFNPEDWYVRSFWHDDKYRLVVNMYEDGGVCLPMILDQSIENGVNYTIRKKILSPTGETNYTVIYTGCKVIDYKESGLDYEDDGIRTINITFDYKDYTYDL